MSEQNELVAFLNDLEFKQRLALGITASLMIIVVALHFPPSGYIVTKEEWKTLFLYHPPCSNEQRNEIKNRLINEKGKTEEYAAEYVKECYVEAPGVYAKSSFYSEEKLFEEEIPISEWRTKKPIVGWFGSLTNTIFALFSIGIVGAIFVIYVFKERSSAN